MGQPLPADDFDRSKTHRAPLGPGSLAGQPDWLTRVGDGGGDEPDPQAPAHEPVAHPAGHAPARPKHHGTTMHLPGHGSNAPSDADSWEGAVERAAKEARYTFIDEAELRGPGFVTRALRSFNPGALVSSVLGGISRFKPVILVALAVIAVVAALMMRPREEQTASIGAIRRHPERFEGRPVKVKGRVGEVFVVGGGYAFTFHQGRENIGVFTRSRVPVRREELTITGSISNGTLDGKTRQALFETAE